MKALFFGFIFALFFASTGCSLRSSRDEEREIDQNKKNIGLDCPDRDTSTQLKHIPKPRVGVIVTVYNRPEYLRPMLESLKHSEMDDSVSVVLVDDASKDGSTIRIFDKFEIPSIKKPVKKIRFEKNRGLLQALLAGMDALKDSTDYITNLDPDVYVKKNWIPSMIKTFEAINHPKLILSGFNTPAHPIVGQCSTFDSKKRMFCEKEHLGGVNFFFTTNFYNTNFAPWLKEIEEKFGWRPWDWKVMECMEKNKLKVYSTSPSVLQHLGAIGTNATYDGPFDFAEDF